MEWEPGWEGKETEVEQNKTKYQNQTMPPTSKKPHNTTPREGKKLKQIPDV